MNKISFTILGVPQTWQRVKTNKFGQKYKPRATADFQNRIRQAALEAFGSSRPADLPCIVEINAFFPPPKSMPKYLLSYVTGESLPYQTTPDVDNVTKNVLDAIQYTVISNDSRVATVLCRKRYSFQPRLEVTVWLLDMPKRANLEAVKTPQLNLFQGVT